MEEIVGRTKNYTIFYIMKEEELEIWIIDKNITLIIYQYNEYGENYTLI